MGTHKVTQVTPIDPIAGYEAVTIGDVRLRAFYNSLVATFLTFAVLDGIILWQSMGYTQWRQVRTEFAFVLPSHNWLAILICMGTSMVALLKRQWIVPVCVCFVLLYFSLSLDMLVISGGAEISRVMPLYELRVNLILAAWLPMSAFMIVSVAPIGASRATPHNVDFAIGKVVAEAILATYGPAQSPSTEIGRSEAGFPTLTIGRPPTSEDVAELEDE
ncbi:MAG: hypothetical protein P4L46_26505 [Fimbriimonas sp.]|nr:hypothetical protein [Fimbriimonas sp.]